MSAGAEIRCSNCSATFVCSPAGDCWCKTPPYLPLPAGGETCLCPDCLAKAKAAARPKPDNPWAS